MVHGVHHACTRMYTHAHVRDFLCGTFRYMLAGTDYGCADKTIRGAVPNEHGIRLPPTCPGALSARLLSTVAVPHAAASSFFFAVVVLVRHVVLWPQRMV